MNDKIRKKIIQISKSEYKRDYNEGIAQKPLDKNAVFYIADDGDYYRVLIYNNNLSFDSCMHYHIKKEKLNEL